jgi:outer membrane receptor protein involved in Fe transport
LAAVLSQTSPAGAVTGRVFDTSRGALVGAEVVLTCDRVRLVVTTDASGEFAIGRVPLERCAVTVTREGFVGMRAIVDLGETPAAPVEFHLAVRPFSSEVGVTARRGVEVDTSQLVQAATLVTPAELAARPYTLVTQALKEEAGVLAQQTTASQGSPILRGFTGQRNLYLLDGVRYNTAAWRDGPSQYLAWLPASDAERIELVRGPASSQYGSDALGGTVGVFSPMPSTAAPARQSGSVGFTLGTANELRASDIGVFVERSRVAIRLAASAAGVSDLRAGGGIDSHAAVTRFLGLPSTVVGPRLEQTGYTQTSLSASARMAAGKGRSLTASVRHAQQNGSHRYDQEMGGNGRYRSEFGPQRLDFAWLRYEGVAAGWLDQLSATVSMNRQADGRLEQARPSARLDEQVNTTTAMGYALQGGRVFSRRLNATFGADVYDERIGSERTLLEPGGAANAARPDIPDGTRYTSVGVFWQQRAELVPGRVEAVGGLRFGHFGFGTRADAALGVTAESMAARDVTFNAGAVVSFGESLSATVSASRGFRAANAFDLGAIGLSGGGGFEVAPGHAARLGGRRGSTDGASAVDTGAGIGALGPEQLYAYESGLRWHSPRASGMVTVFDLEFHDAIERRTIIFTSSVAGQDISGFEVVRQDAAGRAYVAADARPIVTRVNVGRARILGFEADASVRVTGPVRARAWASAAHGTERETGAPSRRMPPLVGGVSVTWQSPASPWWIEGTVLVAAAQVRLSDGDLGDARIGAARTPASIASFFTGTATDRGLVQNGRLVATGETLAEVQARVLGGAAILPLFAHTPGFASIGVRAGFPLGRRLDLVVIGENLTDASYRLHGSGVDEPGINLQTRLRIRF